MRRLAYYGPGDSLNLRYRRGRPHSLRSIAHGLSISCSPRILQSPRVPTEPKRRASSVAPGRIDTPLREPISSARLLVEHTGSIPTSTSLRREQHSSSLQHFASTSRLDQYSAGLYIAYQAIGSAFSAWSREFLAGSLSCACHVGAKVGSDRSGLWRVERVSDGLSLQRLRPLT